MVGPDDGHRILELGVVPPGRSSVGAGEDHTAHHWPLVVVRVDLISSWLQLSEPFLGSLLDVPIAVSSQGLLVVPLVVEPLGLNVEPGQADPLLEQSSGAVEVVAVVAHPDLEMVCEELSGCCSPSLPVGVEGVLVPARSAIREQQCEV